MKKREADRILEYLGLEPPHPSKGAIVRAPSSKAGAKTNKKHTKK